jgi:hypothetical protein
MNYVTEKYKGALSQYGGSQRGFVSIWGIIRGLCLNMGDHKGALPPY